MGSTGAVDKRRGKSEAQQPSLPDDEEFLARSPIPATRIVRQPAVANTQPINDRQPDWIGDLHRAPTHVQSCMPCVSSRQTPQGGKVVSAIL